MQSSPSKISQNKSTKKSPKVSISPSSQHGFRLLSLDFPPETLNWTTSFLGPKELFDLSTVSKHLHAHVALESTWRSAFVRMFLGIDPETPSDGRALLLLRRLEPTWQREYVFRCRIQNRWQNSRSPTVSHTPHHSIGKPIFFLPDVTCLLSASLAYGIVSRSVPSTGKVLKGFLDASGTANGGGIGNPNVEFTPDVSVIALAGSGGTAVVAWGFRTGTVAVTHATKVVEQTRIGNRRFIRCAGEHAHGARVTSIVFCNKAVTFVTGGVDGAIKLWDTGTVRVIWSFAMTAHGEPESCLQVAYDSGTGTVAAAFHNGALAIWTGLSVADGTITTPAHSVIVPPPDGTVPENHAATVDSITLKISPSISETAILFQPNSAPYFDRVVVSQNISTPYRRTRFAGGPLGPLTSIEIDFAPPSSHPRPPPRPITDTSPLALFAVDLPAITPMRQTSFVVAGDALGRVCVWDWDDGGRLGEHGVMEASSRRRLEAHDDGGVSAMQLAPYVWVTGSTRGTVQIWDSLTLDHLRTIASPSSRPTNGLTPPRVEQVVVDHTNDVLLISIGSRVVYWKPGSPHFEKKGKAKALGVHAIGPARASTERWYQQMEIKSDVRDTREAMEAEKKHLVKAHNRRTEQHKTLDTLGLSESEALAYAMMLSQEESPASLRSSSTSPKQTHQNVPTTPKAARAIPTASDSPALSKKSSPQHPHSPTSKSPQSAWSRGKPLQTPDTRGSGEGRSRGTSGPGNSGNDDDDLRYALELSLAEAESLMGLE